MALRMVRDQRANPCKLKPNSPNPLLHGQTGLSKPEAYPSLSSRGLLGMVNRARPKSRLV
jgi:hypothetical protein